MKSGRRFVLGGILCLALVPNTAWAPIIDGANITIEFRKDALPSEVTFSKHMGLADGGLVYQGRPPVPGTWVQSHPIPIGFAWTIPNGVSVSLSVDRRYTLEKGRQGRDTDRLRPYFRYGVDKVHWSTWIPLPESAADAKRRGDYELSYTIPEAARDGWRKLSQEWAAKDKSWDLSRFFGWIERCHPDYLAKEIPFVGYVQVLVEWPAYSLETLSISQMKVHLGWGLGGAAMNRRSEDGTPLEDVKGVPPRWGFSMRATGTGEAPKEGGGENPQ
ncbi:MAG: hypothetical protein FJ291_15860 [Planctomycetes bacterium]|nr:hypothetical protein [Planctomycetota bacterium]